MFKKTLLTIAALTFAAIANLQADIRMPALFTDNMVLQRGVSVPIWGFASEGEKVTVKYQRQSVSAKTKNGRWIVNLKPLANPAISSSTVATESNSRTSSSAKSGSVADSPTCSGP
jgi:sialate O-acetylesterase